MLSRQSSRKHSRTNYLRISLKSRRILTFLCVFGALIFLLNFYFLRDQHLLPEPDQEVIIDLSKNYFQTAEQLSQRKFLVHNDKCRIPDIDIWDKAVLPFIRNSTRRQCNGLNLTYVKGESVLINKDVLTRMGYRLEEISCCYQTVHRVEQAENNFDKNADNIYRISGTCYPMGKVTQPHFGFIRVTCTKGWLFFYATIYTNFHAVARLPENEEDEVSRKVAFWKRCYAGLEENEFSCRHLQSTGQPPPSVLILGIDSVSRLNFHRFLPKTRSLMEHVGAVELTGYTKVSHNTFPNFVTMMSSFSAEELSKICYFTQWTPQDKCPYLWRNFSNLNYITAHLEDDPTLAIFNFAKTGFRSAPVDMYLRPWMLALYEGFEGNGNCFDSQRSEEIVLNYLVDLTTLSHSKGVPFFITAWLTDLTHGNMNNVALMDGVLENALQRLKEGGVLDNTVLFLISDHGFRYFDIRSTTSGWYEDKLPFNFISLPNDLKDKHPEWLEALQYNSKQLTTPFDIHATLRSIMNLTAAPNEATGHGLTLFDKLPSRTCEETWIPKEYCACSAPVAHTENLDIVVAAAKQVVSTINSRIPPKCKPLRLLSILSSGLLDSSISNSSNGHSVELIISLTTSPGEFRYEAIVAYDQLTATFFTPLSLISRTSKIVTSLKCITDDQVNFDVYCYCPK